MTSGGNMGFFGSGAKRSPKSDDSDVSSAAESEVDSDEEDVVGYVLLPSPGCFIIVQALNLLRLTIIDVGRYHVEPRVGHRVILRETCKRKFPELVKENGNTTGTITWVDPTDADGDGGLFATTRCLAARALVYRRGGLFVL